MKSKHTPTNLWAVTRVFSPTNQALTSFGGGTHIHTVEGASGREYQGTDMSVGEMGNMKGAACPN